MLFRVVWVAIRVQTLLKVDLERGSQRQTTKIEMDNSENPENSVQFYFLNV